MEEIGKIQDQNKLPIECQIFSNYYRLKRTGINFILRVTSMVSELACFRAAPAPGIFFLEPDPKDIVCLHSF